MATRNVVLSQHQHELVDVAQADIVTILAWSEEQFGKGTRKRYEALIATAIRDAAARTDDVGRTADPSWGTASFPGTWRRVAPASRGGDCPTTATLPHLSGR